MRFPVDQRPGLGVVAQIKTLPPPSDRVAPTPTLMSFFTRKNKKALLWITVNLKKVNRCVIIIGNRNIDSAGQAPHMRMWGVFLFTVIKN